MCLKTDTVIRSSNEAFLSDAFRLLEWAATTFIGHVGTKFVITVALISDVSGTDLNISSL